MERNANWTWAALGIMLVLIFGGTGLMMATMKSGVAQKARQSEMKVGEDEARVIFDLSRKYREAYGNFPVTRRRVLWTRANGLEATLAGLINYAGPKGHPRFDYYLDASGGVSAFANAEDPGLDAVDMAILVDSTGTMSTTRAQP